MNGARRDDKPVHEPAPQLIAIAVAELSTVSVFVAPTKLMSYMPRQNRSLRDERKVSIIRQTLITTPVPGVPIIIRYCTEWKLET